MTTTYSTDAQVYTRSPLAGKGLARVNAERADLSLAALTLDDYRVEASRVMLLDLAAAGIALADITDTTALLDPEVCLTLALVFEAATIRQDEQQGPVDVFAGQAKRWRAAYDATLAKARPVEGVRSVGSSFSWDRG